MANTAAVGFGAYNLPSSMRNLNTRVMGNSYGIQSQRVMDPNAGKGVSTKVKAPKSSNTRVQKMGKGEGHQGGVRNGFRQSSTGGTSAKITHYQQAPTTRNVAPAREVGGWQMNRPNTPIVPTWGTPPVPVSTRQQPQEAAEYTPVPFRPRPASKPALQEVNFSAPFYGSPEFQQAYAEAERQGLSEFNFGNSPYKVERGANYRQGRTVSPQGVNPNIVNSPNSRFTHFPDSTSYSGVVNNPSSTQVNTLNYGVTGNPRIDTTSINNLRAAMRKLGGRVNYISY